MKAGALAVKTVQGCKKKEKKGDANIFAFEAVFSIPAD